MSYHVSGNVNFPETAVILDDDEQLSSSSLFDSGSSAPIGVLMDRTRYNKVNFDAQVPDHLNNLHEGWLSVTLNAPVINVDDHYQFVTGSLEDDTEDLAAMGWVQSSSSGISATNIGGQVINSGSMIWPIGGLPPSGAITHLKVYANGGDLHLKTAARTSLPAVLPRYELFRQVRSSVRQNLMSSTIVLDKYDTATGSIAEYSASHTCSWNLPEPSLLNAERAHFLRFGGELGTNSKEGAYLIQAVFVRVTSSTEGAS